MKHIFRMIAVLGVIAVTAGACACSDTATEVAVTPTGSAAQTEAAAPSTAPAEAPTAEPTEAAVVPVTEAPAETAQAPQVTDSSSADKDELVNSDWVLSEVYVDGEKYQGNYYGSVVSQTGAYIAFYDDDTFLCILGMSGCKGTYSIDAGVVTLHITTKYTGADTGKPADESETLTWDREAGTVSFELNSVTNVFDKNK